MAGFYKHTQIGYLMLFVICIGLLMIFNLSERYDNTILLGAGAVILFFMLLTFSSLNVEIINGELKVKFGLGIITRSFPIPDIESAEIVKNPWYYGWGVRKTPKGWLYNVSGFTAVEIVMIDGNQVRIGTNDPMGLKSALDNARGGGSA